ncbi:phage tail tape measure protein [Acinetobacter cumulans]|uniref:Phage tail tape measure protein n=1 Tax=Acinetobacter cumulans TaxID=2136182 RepID=A0A498CUC8_9GAMM|nr:phage tail tape measure protein [Acinetobacter cumulans]RLL33743.1 phage tail tape measure protein [Acinetobacter cumulans]
MKALKLEVIFGAKNKLSPALKLIVGSSNAASKALKKTNDQLKDLERQQNKIATFRKLKEDVKQATVELDKTNKKISSLKDQLSRNPNSQLSAELKKAETEARRLNKVITEGKPKLMALRQELNQAGLKSTNLAQHQEKLKNQIHGTNTEIDKQKKYLQNLNRVQQSTQKMSGHVRNAGMYGAGAAATGVTAMYQLRKPINETKHVDLEENRIASLGLGKKATEEAIQYAKAMKTFGTSTLENLQLVRDGVTAFADVHHAQMVAPTLAKMKFANAAMYGDDGAENEKKFMDMLKVIEMRNGLKSEKAFQEQANIIQQVITATGGRVQAEEWLNVIKTGGIAAKGIENQAFYYKLEPLVQEMGGFRVGTAMMSAYQNVYQGRTTKRAANNLERLGLISDPSKVQHDKSGQISFLDVGAIKGAELFKKDQFAWMEQVLVPQLKSKGITKEGDIIDAMGSIFTNRTASNLFAQMYMQRDQIHKNAKLNAGADNIDQLNNKAMGTTTGKEIEARANLHDAYLKFGTTILPIYTKAIETATGALQSFNGWMERNPTLAKMLGVGLLGIAASLVVIGGALAVFSPLILGMLSLRLIMASASAGGTGLMRVFSVLPTVMNILKTSLFMVGRTFLWLGRALLMNPIGLAITAIGVAAYLIYRNWTPIKTFFIGLWASVKNAFNTGITFIKNIIKGIDATFASNPILNLLLPLIGIPRIIISNWSTISSFFSSLWSGMKEGAASAWTSIVTFFSPIGTWFAQKWESAKEATSNAWNSIKATVTSAWNGLITAIQTNPILLKIIDGWNKIFTYLGSLKDRMMSIGSNVIQGLIEGIKTGFEKLKSIWATVNSYMPDFMKKRMDIHSPSRVMAGLGGHIMGGLGLGLQQGFPELKTKFADVLGIFNPNVSGLIQKINVAPALSKIRNTHALPSGSNRGDIVIQGDTITMHIHTQPGQSVQQIAQVVNQVLSQREHQKLARARNSFMDNE